MSIGTRTAPGAGTSAVATALRIRLLGAFQIAVADRLVPDSAWRLRKARSLVKLVALHPAQRLPREQVMDLLWPDLDTNAAMNNLRVALHAARRVLAPHGTIDTAGDALSLSAANLWIDVAAFDTAAATARQTRDPADYAHALDLDGGELLPEDRYEDWASVERDRLRGLHLALLLDVAALHEGTGDWPTAIAARQRALALEPAHEGAHTGLMRLYALAGQRSRALRQWDQFVAAFRRDLDAAPDAASQALRDEIAAGRFPPTGEPASAARGGRYRHNLPAPLTTLIGREADLRAAKEALADTRLLTLTGAGGCGKTRLAVAIATDLLAAYPGGIWLVELAALTDPALVPGAIAGVLGLREETERPLLETIAARLAGQATLLVLDNCEHLREPVAEMIATLLAACPALRILATSRAALRVSGEAIWRVPSLAVPAALAATPAHRALADLAAVPAVRLFLERVRQRQPAFALSPQNARPVAEIARRLDGIPLALELAAARIAILPVEALASRLDDALRLLTSGNRAAAPRHQTLRATLDWSYNLLTAPQRALLQRLSLFAEGATFPAIEAVCTEVRSQKLEVRNGAGGEPDFSLLTSHFSLLAALVEHSLVQVDPDAAEARYHLLETVRQYAADRLLAGGEGAAPRERHAAHYLALAEEAVAHLDGAGAPAWLARLDREHGNLRAALGWYLESVSVIPALRLVGAVWHLWCQRGYASEGRRWCAAVLALPIDPADPAAARALALALRGAGELAYAQGDHGEALALCVRGLALQRARGDDREAGLLLTLMGAAATGQHHYDEAGLYLDESLALLRAVGDTDGIAAALTSLGLLAVYRGTYDRARAHYDEALAIYRAQENRPRVALLLTNLAEVVEYAGDFPRAEAMYGESLALFQELGDAEGIAMAHDNLGVTLRGMGEYARAAAHHEQGLIRWREIGNRWRAALALTNLGATLYHLDELTRARALDEESLGLFRAEENTWGCALALENLGRVTWAQGDRERAVEHFTESLALYRQLDNSGGIITTLGDLGQAARLQGDLDRALALYREGVARCQQANDRSRLPAPLEGLAALAADRGATTAAARLFGAAAALRTALGKPLAPNDRPDHEAIVAAVLTTLGDDAFAAAWAAGQVLPLAEIFHLANHEGA